MPIEKTNSLESDSFSRANFLPKDFPICGSGNIVTLPETGSVMNKGLKRCGGSQQGA